MDIRALLQRLWRRGKPAPENLRRGAFGERAARRHLQRLGWRLLAANYRSDFGEIDLIFRDRTCLVFVEVKARSSEEWSRPADAVDAAKQRRISRTAFDYLRRLGAPAARFRFDIVEVLLEQNGDVIREIRHIPNAFPLTRPLRYG